MATVADDVLDAVKILRSGYKICLKMFELEAKGKQRSKEYKAYKDLLLETNNLAKKKLVPYARDEWKFDDLLALIGDMDAGDNPEFIDDYQINLSGIPKEEDKKVKKEVDIDTPKTEDEIADMVIEQMENSDQTDKNILKRYQIEVICHNELFDFSNFSCFNKFNALNIHSYLAFYDELVYDPMNPVPHKRKSLVVPINGQIYDIEKNYSEILETYGDEVAQPLKAQLNQFNIEEDDRLLAVLTYYLFQLESHVYYAYLLDAIKKADDPDVKYTLMAIKYGYLSNVGTVAESFALDANINDVIEYYSKRLFEILKENPDFQDAYIKRSEVIIDEMQSQLLEREKEQYDDLEDLISDIVQNLYVNTVLSLSINDEERKRLIDDIKTAEGLVKSPIEKRNFQLSRKIKKDLTLSRNIQK